MSDSSSFTSLHELVQSHLSQLSFQDTQPNASINQVPITKHELTAKVIETGVLTPGQLLNPPGRLFPPMVPCTSSNSSVSVLAQQVANMFKAKELKRLEEEQEKKPFKKNVKLTQTDDYVIDFSSAIIDSSALQPRYVKEKNCHKDFDSGPNSIEEDEPILIHEEGQRDPSLKVEIVETMDSDDKMDEDLPCPVDLSHLLTKKMKRGKCSPFGRVVCARYTNKSLPYVYKHYPSSIMRFDFSTLSPDEIAIKNMKKIEKKVDFSTEIGLQKSEMLIEREKLNGYKNQRGMCLY